MDDDQKKPNENNPLEGDRLEELRHLLFGNERERLDHLQERLEDPTKHATDISQVLPEAIVIGTRRDSKLATALMPTVEEIVRASVKKDIRTFVDALFPVIGPAIRKSISETFKQMIQSLNTALDQSLSWQGLKWRLESIRTGRPFAEVVLLNSLVYRVEQVFLIHRETGLLLQHVKVESEAFQDADLVSSMLTAIEDFVRDSFQMERHQSLETIQMGDVTLWIDQGPSAVLAGAIRGNAPEELRSIFHNTLENIHLEKSELLSSFEGDTAPFESIRHHLEGCLQAGYREKKRKFSPVFILLTVVVAAAVIIWGTLTVQNRLQWKAVFQELAATQGIVITAVEKKKGHYHVRGLRDPLAVDPIKFAADAGMNLEKVTFHFEPYQAMIHDFTLKRAESLLHPPRGVTLALDDHTLVAKGEAPYSWILESQKLANAVPGVFRLDTSRLKNSDLIGLDPPKSVSLNLDGDTLTATGSAGHQWIFDTRQKVKGIAGVKQYDDTALKDLDAEAFSSLITALENEVILFEFNTADHISAQAETINRILKRIVLLADLGQVLGKNPVVTVAGHTDSSGSKKRNLELSQQRANQVRSWLVAGGLEPKMIEAVGMGATNPVREGDREADQLWNRSATLTVSIKPIK